MCRTRNCDPAVRQGLETDQVLAGGMLLLLLLLLLVFGRWASSCLGDCRRAHSLKPLLTLVFGITVKTTKEGMFARFTRSIDYDMAIAMVVNLDGYLGYYL